MSYSYQPTLDERHYKLNRAAFSFLPLHPYVWIKVSGAKVENLLSNIMCK